MAKHLALFLDGTWNEPDDDTNVSRLHSLVAPQAGGLPQHTYYHKGVGCSGYDRLFGGTVGAGLSDNVRRAYDWLAHEYQDGDDVYIFGFSRGAYTARSVAGVIIKCGLYRQGGNWDSTRIYARYRQGKAAVPIYRLQYIQQTGQRALTNEEDELLANSRRIDLKMVGVWDTVGALGVPWTEAPLIGRRNFYFHDTNLSVLIEHAYHALALDEHRGPYKPTLWTRFQPTGAPTDEPPPKKQPTVEQRWFIGAHANVGGGYAKDHLRELPLAWLQAKAAQVGLGFTQTFSASPDAGLGPVRDSFGEFLNGAYKWLRLGRPYYRPVGAGARPVQGGTSTPLNEQIDASVFARYQQDPTYRPANLIDWAKRKQIDLMTVRGDQTASPQRAD